MAASVPDKVFETARLRAVHWRHEHAAAAFEMYGDPEVGRYIGGHQQSLESMSATIERMIELGPTLPHGMGSFPLLLRDDPALPLIGAALIKPLPDADEQRTDDVEIGWHVAQSHWGQGYATEAGRGLLRLGFERLGLDVLHAVVQAPNEASHAVVRHLGMRRLGTTCEYYGGLELVHYRLERAAWRAAASG